MQSASACSRVLAVIRPNVVGTPLVRPTSEMPRAASPATYSKCGVSPRITQPTHTSASTPPPAASRAAACGSSKAPGTQTTRTSPARMP